MSQSVFVSDDDSLDKLRGKRLASIDLLRGLVMVLMTLDHVRDFFSNARFNPLDLTQSNVPLFLTRWVTHFCAPSFVFLAGIAAYLSVRRGKSKQELSQFLFIRGLWLIFLELTVVLFAWTFDLSYSIFIAGVLWAIGWSMIVLAALVHLPTRVVGAIGILLIVGHNLFDNVHADQLGTLGWLWAVLHEPKRLELLAGIRFFTFYSLIPWIGVMAAGYTFGSVFELEKSQRRQLLQRFGFSLILTFIILRAINFYGDPKPWTIQPSVSHTVLSFLNCNKYPPSLLYLLMTLGLALLMLNLFENHIFRFLKPLAIFGQVPLFFYIVHIPLIHLTACLFALPQYGFQAFTLPYILSSRMPADYGYELPMIYDIWLIMVVVLYPICNWFAEYKRKHRWWWLKYL